MFWIIGDVVKEHSANSDSWYLGGEVKRRHWPTLPETPAATELHLGRFPGVSSLPWSASPSTRVSGSRILTLGLLLTWRLSFIQGSGHLPAHPTFSLGTTLNQIMYFVFLVHRLLNLTRSKAKCSPPSLGLTAEKKLSRSVDQIRSGYLLGS